jgi:hypothetical protein
MIHVDVRILFIVLLFYYNYYFINKLCMYLGHYELCIIWVPGYFNQAEVTDQWR